FCDVPTPTETYTLSLPDALPILPVRKGEREGAGMHVYGATASPVPEPVERPPSGSNRHPGRGRTRARNPGDPRRALARGARAGGGGAGSRPQPAPAHPLAAERACAGSLVSPPHPPPRPEIAADAGGVHE